MHVDSCTHWEHGILSLARSAAGASGGIVFGLRLIRVIGPSMEPALRNGEVWVASRGRVRPGSLVVLCEPGRPALLAVKRAIAQHEDGWWVSGDNPASSRDSRHYGPVAPKDIVAVLRFRVR
jgi:nickel-type superoxide dismutase maturation protease